MKVSEFRDFASKAIGGLDDDDEIRLVVYCDRDGYSMFVMTKTENGWEQTEGVDLETDDDDYWS